jgi:hypothetical protein
MEIMVRLSMTIKKVVLERNDLLKTTKIQGI